MKNLIRKISLIMCVIMLTFAVSACGKSDNDSKKNEPKTEDTANLQSQASTFESVASSLKAAVEVENPVVVVRYLDNTGAEIVAQEFAG